MRKIAPTGDHSAGGPNPRRYNAFGDYLRQRFGGRIHKVSLDAGFGCPPGDQPGKQRGGGCVYCENAAFSPHLRRSDPLPLAEQLARGIRHGRVRYRAKGFLAYFQSFTNTYAPLEVLRERYDVIRAFPEIVGLAVGTRPDCVDEAILDLLESYRPDYEVWLEYGLQSAHNETLARIRRGHTCEDFLNAVEMAAHRDLKLCVHVILGLPGEGREEMMATAGLLARLPLQGVKIHHCHVIQGTPLAEDFSRGEYQPLDYSEYLALVCDFLERLPWQVTIQRLIGEAPAHLLLAPRWDRNKAQILEDIHEALEQRGSTQGLLVPT